MRAIYPEYSSDPPDYEDEWYDIMDDGPDEYYNEPPSSLDGFPYETDLEREWL
jgi:hypothetical protein